MAFSNTTRRGQYGTAITIDTATLSGSYVLAGILAAPAQFLKFLNNSNKDVSVSTDGTNLHDFVATKTGSVTDWGSDGQTKDNSEKMALPAGTEIWVSAATGTGLFYIIYGYQGD